MDLDLPLKEYGLSDKEIKVYLTLLPLGTVNLQEVAKRVDFPRTTVYNTLTYLLEKGLVSTIQKKNIHYFTATDPDKLSDKLEEKKRLIHSILPQLKEMKTSNSPTSSVEIYEGFKGIHTILSDVFKIKQQVCYFGGYKKSLDILQHLPESARIMRIERGIHARIVIEPSNEEIFHTSNYKKYTEMRFMDSMKDFPAMIFIYGNKVAMYALEKDLIGVIISNEQVANAMRIVFDMYWVNAKPAKL